MNESEYQRAMTWNPESIKCSDSEIQYDSKNDEIIDQLQRGDYSEIYEDNEEDEDTDEANIEFDSKLIEATFKITDGTTISSNDLN